MMKIIKSIVVAGVLSVFVVSVNGQTTQSDVVNNIVSTAVPFLNIAPESRAGGMGDAGVATSPDYNSQYWNPAKYAFIDGSMGASVSFTPWLRELIGDINLSYVSFYYRLDDMQTLSSSLTYFSLGDITYTDETSNVVGTGNPNEFALDVAYSRILSDQFSGGVAFRYIRSDILNGSPTAQSLPGNSFAADIAFYYHTSWKKNRKKSALSAGINISNIGSKISYDGGNTKEFIPTNLRLGAAYSMDIDEYNQVMFTADINKLLVPSVLDTTAAETSVISGIFKSFSDAPGGFSEELQEIRISGGVEYWYNKQFAIRAGYHHENENKGNRKYATAGVGLKFNMFNIDASYIIPMESNNPLANTIRFSLGFDLSQFGSSKGKKH
ncbi:MAG: type IX secretion system outer membrane channel protein PorV [Chlorobi bacterium]|nr:type IX secretion system outer membrane channel protein PorV [Chlorobiota bacterium]